MTMHTATRNFVKYDRALKAVGDTLLKIFDVSRTDDPDGRRWCFREAQLALGNAAGQGHLTVWGCKVIRFDGRGSPVEFDPEPTEIPQVSWAHLEVAGTGDAQSTYEHGQCCYMDLVFDQHELDSLKPKWPGFLDEITTGDNPQSPDSQWPKLARSTAADDSSIGGDSTAEAGDINKYRSGYPGRPTTKHLIEPEFERRAKAHETCSSLREEAEALLEWVTREHPGAHPPTAKTICNNIRERYRAIQGAQN